MNYDRKGRHSYLAALVRVWQGNTGAETYQEG
jgi:hypothetical protein